MKLTVINKEILVGNIRVTGVSASSVFLIGDTYNITASSIFDTPPESVMIGLTPFAVETPAVETPNA